MKMEIVLKRKYSKEIAVTYLPSFLLILIASSTPCLCFWSHDVPLAISLATLIIQIVLMNSLLVRLPPTTFIKMIDIWIIFGQLVSFSAFVIISIKKLNRDRFKRSIKISDVGADHLLPQSNSTQHNSIQVGLGLTFLRKTTTIHTSYASAFFFSR